MLLIQVPADKSTFLELDKSEFEVSGLSAKPETSQTSTHADLVTKAIDEINSTDLQKDAKVLVALKPPCATASACRRALWSARL